MRSGGNQAARVTIAAILPYGAREAKSTFLAIPSPGRQVYLY